MMVTIPERQVRIMEMQNNEPIRTPTPRRRRRSKLQIFKEAYLPTIILAVTAVLVLVFIIGGIVNSGDAQLDKPSGSSGSSSGSSGTTSPTNSSSTDPALAQEAADLMDQAAVLAADYDYAGAVASWKASPASKPNSPNWSLPSLNTRPQMRPWFPGRQMRYTIFPSIP